MYMEKNNIPFDYYEKRDKKINYNTIEKREMNYSENYTKPRHFDSIEEFENFSYKITKDVDINLLRR